MRHSMPYVLHELVSAHRRGGSLVLLFDYDGTLAPFAEEPRLATLPPDTRQALARLTKCTNVQVGVLSGRTLADLKTMLPLPGLFLAGTCGVELDLYGKEIVHPSASLASLLLQDVAPQLEKQLARYPGAWVEDKQYAWTVHYRKAPPSCVGELLAGIERITRSYRDRLQVVPGPMAVEINANLGWNKGEAVYSIMEHLDEEDATVFYAGDSANDAEAFDAVASLGGICVGVGPDAPVAAEHRVSGPAALRSLLIDLVASLDERRFRLAGDRLTLHRHRKSALVAGW